MSNLKKNLRSGTASMRPEPTTLEKRLLLADICRETGEASGDPELEQFALHVEREMPDRDVEDMLEGMKPENIFHHLPAPSPGLLARVRQHLDALHCDWKQRNDGSRGVSLNVSALARKFGAPVEEVASAMILYMAELRSKPRDYHRTPGDILESAKDPRRLLHVCSESSESEGFINLLVIDLQTGKTHSHNMRQYSGDDEAAKKGIEEWLNNIAPDLSLPERPLQ